MHRRRIAGVYLCARNVAHILHLFRAGSLLVAPYDRTDIFLAAALATVNRIPMAGIVVTGGEPTDPHLLELCRPAFSLGLPMFSVPTDSFATATALSRISNEIPADDRERFDITLDFIARQIDVQKLQSRMDTVLEFRMSPAAFRHQLANRARKADKRIVLPEGNEPRTIVAAAICRQRGLARCVLLGDPGGDPARRRAPTRVARMRRDHRPRRGARALRRRTGRTAQAQAAHREPGARGPRGQRRARHADARAAARSTAWSPGAVHSSANTIRPALQLIKTKPGRQGRLLGVLHVPARPGARLRRLRGDSGSRRRDAGRHRDPERGLGRHASAFPPRVAMISYSHRRVGQRRRMWTKSARPRASRSERRPDLLIDGPLQYDAAAIADVAAKKAPDSPVAGQATVFVFPDLNTGNTTYKAVQRSANVVSIGPMLQGLRKPGERPFPRRARRGHRLHHRHHGRAGDADGVSCPKRCRRRGTAVPARRADRARVAPPRTGIPTGRGCRRGEELTGRSAAGLPLLDDYGFRERPEPDRVAVVRRSFGDFPRGD